MATSLQQNTATFRPNESLSGSRKGEETRGRILQAALEAFGAEGFKGATTRQIAEAAGVNLPALRYYFGGKEGLYLACAREIVARYESRMLGPVGAAVLALQAEPSPDQARDHLKSVIGALAEQLMAAEQAQVWTAFFLREMADQGPAFDILYARVWAPGVELTALLIARARGLKRPDDAARIQALTLISGLSAFTVARPVALRIMDWPDTDADRFARIREVIFDQIAAIA